MKVEFSVDGGIASFPGLRAPVLIDATTLSPAHGARLRALLAEARFFDVAAPARAATAPDGRCYTIAADDGLRSRTLTLDEPIASPALRDLVAELSARARDVRNSRGRA
jgi:hypothetical protein